MTKPPRKSGVQSSFDNVFFLESSKAAVDAKRPAGAKLGRSNPVQQGGGPEGEFSSNAPLDRVPGNQGHEGRANPRRTTQDGLSLFGPGEIAPDGRSFEQCADDLQKAIALLKRGDLPRLSLLDQAPILHDWMIVVADYNSELLMISGLFENHPTIADGRYGHTSPLMALDQENPKTWARTWSRWYRLGEPRFRDRHRDQGGEQ